MTTQIKGNDTSTFGGAITANNASVLTNAEAISSSLLPSGTIKQVVSAITTAVTVNTSTPTPIVSLNITTTGNSKLYCAFHQI